MTDQRTAALRINDGVQLALLDEDGDEGEMAYTYIESIGEDRVRLPVPSSRGVLLYFSPGAGAAVYVAEDDALYRAECEVLQVLRRRRIPMVEISPPGEFTRVQRRSHVRWRCSLEVTWCDPAAACSDTGQGEATTVNISCGGMLCKSSRRLRPGKQYEFALYLTGEEVIACEGKIVRSRHSRREDLAVWAVNFTQISDADQDRIQAFIFNEQLKMRRLGLL